MVWLEVLKAVFEERLKYAEVHLNWTYYVVRTKTATIAEKQTLLSFTQQ